MLSSLINHKQKIFKFFLGLFISVFIWSWLRFLGSFWINDALNQEYVGMLFDSLGVFQFGINSLLISIIPVGTVYFVLHQKIQIYVEAITYIIQGAIFGMLYTFYVSFIASFSPQYFISHAPVIMGAGMMAGLVFSGVIYLPLFDAASEKNKSALVSRRKAISSLLTGIGGIGVISSSIGPFKILRDSGSYIDVDASRLTDGEFLSIEIGSRPVWVFKRSEHMIERLKESSNDLLDPHSKESRQPDEARNEYRSIDPSFLVIYAVCTHLGCAPSFRPEGGATCGDKTFSGPLLFCPCHNGVFDMAGRVFKGTPPPVNLAIPDYEIISDGVIRIFYPSFFENWDSTLK